MLTAQQRPDAAQQRRAEARSVLVAEAAHHFGLDLPHLRVAARQEGPPLAGEPSLQDPPVVRMGAALHEPPPLESEQHLVHRLGRHQGPPRQLGVGQTAATIEHAQGRVLVDREPVGLDHRADGLADDPVDAPDEVQQRGGAAVAGLVHSVCGSRVHHAAMVACQARSSTMSNVVASSPVSSGSKRRMRLSRTPNTASSRR